MPLRAAAEAKLAVSEAALADRQTSEGEAAATASQMAAAAKEAFDAGASIMHVHFRDQRPNLGHLPSWDPDIAGPIIEAIRAACPGVIINMSTGVMGPDISGPSACMERVRICTSTRQPP